MDTHLRALAVALTAAVPALVLAALALVCAVLGVAVMAIAGATVASARTVARLRPGARGSGMVRRSQHQEFA